MDPNLKRSLLLENFQNPTNKGLIDDDSYIKVNTNNESCIDELDIMIKIEDNIIKDMRFDGEACAISTSTASVMIKTLIGKSINEALNIIKDEEECLELIDNTIYRLIIRIITWDSEECKKCQMCIPDCPTGAIEFDEDKNTIVRDKNKCLRCSICYQTCPFNVINYFTAKSSLNLNEKMIYITCKPSEIRKGFNPFNENEGGIK